MYKTTITYEVLSEEPIPGHADLEYIAKEAFEGRYVGRFGPTKEEAVTPAEMRQLLYDFGSEPSFFLLDGEEE
jgi:hypothetical protein